MSGFFRRLFRLGNSAKTRNERGYDPDNFVPAAVTFLIGDQLLLQPFPSVEAAGSQAYIALTVAASIGYRFPDKALAIYSQEFGNDTSGGLRIYREMTAAIDKWAERPGNESANLNDLPILKTPRENLDGQKQVAALDVFSWAVTAFRYGVVLGAAHSDLFRSLWEDNKRHEKSFLESLQRSGVEVPDDVMQGAEVDFQAFVTEAAAFVEYYESQVGILPIAREGGEKP
ncbi:MAG: hypothetical protein O2826_07775 [Chloroflexi bacterium]|nr:hypothetical protein [Chloroflexota bacterium]MDA1174400.1 hypothetical protein [Chloroflexota bacterium]